MCVCVCVCVSVCVSVCLCVCVCVCVEVGSNTKIERVRDWEGLALDKNNREVTCEGLCSMGGGKTV